MASFHNITSKLSIESLSESEESFVLYKQEVLFSQLKELSSICEKAGNISCNLDFMLDRISTINYMELQICVIVVPEYIA